MELEQLVDIISDTSFLIHLATHRISNIDSIETEIGNLSFIVPNIVIQELNHLSEDKEKNRISTISKHTIYPLFLVKKFYCFIKK